MHPRFPQENAIQHLSQSSVNGFPPWEAPEPVRAVFRKIFSIPPTTYSQPRSRPFGPRSRIEPGLEL